MNAPDLMSLLMTAHLRLGLTQMALASALGVSRRTVTRWYSGEGRPGGRDIALLARLVHPRDVALAEALFRIAAGQLAAAGQPPPAPLPAREVSPTESKQLVDGVVYAACEAMDASPRTTRPGLLAAFRRARELGVSIDDVERALSPPATVKKAKT